MASTQSRGFGQKAKAPPSSANEPAKKDYSDIYADVAQSERPNGKTSKYIKFGKDVGNPETGLFIPKGTIFDFETFDDIYERTQNPSEDMLNWLNKQKTPYTTEKGVVITKLGQIKAPFKGNKS